MVRLTLLPIVILTVVAVPAAEQGVELRPGLYRVAFSQTAAGEKPHSETNDECMTAEELKNLGSGFINADEVTCKISEHKKTRGKETYAATCTDEDGERITTTGELTGGGEVFKFVMTMTMGRSPTVTMTWTGTRVGECRE